MTFISSSLMLMLTEPLIKQIRLFSLEQERTVISLAMYIILVIDTCFIPVMVRANFQEYGRESWLAYFFSNGRYSDFTDEWYTIVGPQLFANLILLALRPVIEIIFELFYVSTKRSIKNRAYQ